MLVVATAGHVDHGKSTLVRALTGMEPDRLDEERRRGMSIDLGYAWTDSVTFVDVPGHERFIASTLAGLGPAGAVMLVVAADEGWREQTEEHLRAAELLGLTRVLPVVSRVDRADPARAAAGIRARAGVEPVAVSAVTGAGLPELHERLRGLAAEAGRTSAGQGRPRLWVDRVFSLAGAGTVVTGTLAGGSLRPDQQVLVGRHRAVVRELRSRDQVVATAEPGTRVAAALRGVHRDAVRRGDAVVEPDGWLQVDVVDVAVVDPVRSDLPRDAVLHIGSAAKAVRLRSLDGSYARLTWSGPIPLQVGDRGLLRHPGGLGLLGGVVVADVHPTPLRRRGAARDRAHELATTTVLERLGAARADDLAATGSAAEPSVPVGAWRVHPDRWSRWLADLTAVVASEDGVTIGAAASRLGVPDVTIVAALAAEARLPATGGRLSAPDHPQPPEVTALLAALDRHPFDPDLPRLRPSVAAAAERHGLVLRCGEHCLRPDALDVAVRRLLALPQPFSVGAARDALHSSRRVVVPVLEALDASGRTRRHSDGRRTVQVE